MRTKNGFDHASLSTSALDGETLAPKLEEVLWRYANSMRPYEMRETLDFAAFMLYCSYISSNADNFWLYDFDHNYSIDAVKDGLGNKYLAASFIDYYSGLCTKSPALPDLRGIAPTAHDPSKAITTWADTLLSSNLSLLENSNGKTAATIQLVLAKTLNSDACGRDMSESSSSLPIADLVTRLASIEDKNVLDFACGNGVFLATSLAKGAASVCGRDINQKAVMRAKILCFFANPKSTHDITVANALTASSAAPLAQRVLVAPPLGMKLREFDIQDKGYYADAFDAIMGDISEQPLNMEDFCVAKALASLSDDGIAVLHVSASFLFHQQKRRQALRRSLVEGGYLRTVIELPGGCVPGTMVMSALLVISKMPSDEGVFIVDLDSKELADRGYTAKKRGRCQITGSGIDWLANTVEKRNEIPLVSIVADREEILASGSNLCYSTYGDVFDYGSILDEIRPSAEILGDIQTAQANIDTLGAQIADILNAIEKEG